MKCSHVLGFLLWMALLLVPLQGSAETFYVDDTLRIGIRADAGSNGPSIAVVTTGTELELIERSGAYARVRSPNGVEGWVRSAYLSRQKPASLLLKDARHNIDKLESEIQRLQRQRNSGNAAEQQELQTRIEQLETEKSILTTEMQQLKQDAGNTNTVSERPVDVLSFIVNMDKTPIYIAIAALLFLLSLGFLFGVSWHKHQVTKRLGGLSL